MRLHLLAVNPTDSVTEGFLPAAARLGLAVTVVTDQPAAHERAYAQYAAAGGRLPALDYLAADVGDFREVIATIAAGGRPTALFSNSDHLQAQTALAADFFGLPGKDWRAALRTKNKAELRRALADAGLDAVRSAEIGPGRNGEDPADVAEAVRQANPPYPCVVKPREGVASEDVALVANEAELVARCAEIRARRPGVALVAEEFLAGPLHTLETLGDGRTLHTVAAFHTELSPPPYFIEQRLRLLTGPPPYADQVLAQLEALGVGFGACHTEYVVQGERARIIEVNYRAIGDQCDLALADVLGIPLFEHILRTHLGQPLPASLGARLGGRARMEYVTADRAGTLIAAPRASDEVHAGVRLVYRPLREIGTHRPLHHTNRDFLGVLRATGGDERAVAAAVARFLAAHTWEIRP
ncbi:ATP-grasp domain-containing protein [Streptomyces zagrosensis]|uniref:Biotin carboxylase n=1 Tax=Streptomyces zagrosensis TaxID=1042984 RepID=A0A7W9Q9V7_9ACTN|nr:siderophore biosynthesis protein [Streptomyces zagrosensis]MBB5936295.1 biotin carboxylase [Streptomyces zagrosensis]